jgi:hypothetical protein
MRCQAGSAGFMLIARTGDREPATMKGKIGPTLFALPFFGIGVWMTWSIASQVFDAWQMQRRAPVEATLLTAGYETHSGDDTNTYETFEQYRYEFNGREFRSNRVAIGSGGDNIGEFQRDTGRRLERALARRENVTAYVDPNDPSNAVLVPDLRWGLLGFKSIFMLVFGGIGLCLLVFIFRASPGKRDASDPQYADRPWLLNDAWQTASVQSNAKSAMAFMWVFAALWILVSAPIPFLLYESAASSCCSASISC